MLFVVDTYFVTTLKLALYMGYWLWMYVCEVEVVKYVAQNRDIADAVLCIV